MPISPQDAIKALGTVIDPDLKRDIVSLGWVKNLEVGDHRVLITLNSPRARIRRAAS